MARKKRLKDVAVFFDNLSAAFVAVNERNNFNDLKARLFSFFRRFDSASARCDDIFHNDDSCIFGQAGGAFNPLAGSVPLRFFANDKRRNGIRFKVARVANRGNNGVSAEGRAADALNWRLDCLNEFE